MERSRRYKEKVMLMRNLRIDVFRDIKRGAFLKAFCKGRLELFRHYVILKTEIHLSPGLAVKNIICLLLSQNFTEILLNIRFVRMTLD